MHRGVFCCIKRPAIEDRMDLLQQFLHACQSATSPCPSWGFRRLEARRWLHSLALRKKLLASPVHSFPHAVWCPTIQMIRSSIRWHQLGVSWSSFPRDSSDWMWLWQGDVLISICRCRMWRRHGQVISGLVDVVWLHINAVQNRANTHCKPVMVGIQHSKFHLKGNRIEIWYPCWSCWSKSIGLEVWWTGHAVIHLHKRIQWAIGGCIVHCLQ